MIEMLERTSEAQKSMIVSELSPISDNQSSNVGDLLRYWRGQRGLSQLDLALDINISQRHISFVEIGRSVPSRKLLITCSDALNIPLRERNALLLAAGYAPIYQDSTLDDATMSVISDAMDQMLQNHEPNPALLMDRYWNVLRTNSAAHTFFSSLIDLDAFPRPRNFLEMTFDPAALRPFVEDWETVARSRQATGNYQFRKPDLADYFSKRR
jgi:transcriptional regulator with XRE-family HTH domain